MTKREMINKTFEALHHNSYLIGELIKATEEGKIPGVTYGCTVDYHEEQFYKLIRHPKRYKVWDFNYHMNCILEINAKAEKYLETGIWSN